MRRPERPVAAAIFADATGGIGNAFIGNFIFANTTYGINLTGCSESGLYWVTANDCRLVR